MRIVIYRGCGDLKQTLGCCVIYNDIMPVFSAISLERGWVNNKPNVSCVPPGEYTLKYEYSSRFKKKLWELKDVPNRSETKFHSANHFHQLEGCIALGSSLGDIDGDGYSDVLNSAITMGAFHAVLSQHKEIQLTIIDHDGNC